MNTIRYLYRTKRKKVLIATALLIPILFAALLILNLINGSTGSFNDPGTGIIVIDPGHGGVDGGASCGGFLEKEINLSISLRLKKLLEEKGFKAVLTRDRDESLERLGPDGGSRYQRDLSARAAIINGTEAQLFLSIHVNSNFDNPKACGSVVFYGTRYAQSSVLAACVQHSLNRLETDEAGRDAHASQAAGFFLLNNTRMPGILIETAFITNYRERLLLATDEFRDRIAASIAEGVLAYYEKLGVNRPEAAGAISGK
jgi:N-acetylmuramoyl-L-alanine amidase